MKKWPASSKLRINRETLRALQEPQLKTIAGAATNFQYCTSVGPGCETYTDACTQDTCVTIGDCYSRNTCGTAYC